MTSTPPTTVRVLEETLGVDRHGYALTRLLKIGDHRVRIRIRRAALASDSHALAEVFSTESVRTHVLDTPPSTWHEGTPNRPVSPVDAYDIAREALEPIADGLTNRVATFLTA